MSPQPFEERLARLHELSDALFGEAADVDRGESEDMLKNAGVDPEKLKTALYQRMLQKSDELVQAGRPVPPLVLKALEDLRPVSQPRSTLDRTATLRIASLLEAIRDLPRLLGRPLTPAFTPVYRNKKQLSAHDKKLLDGVADDLQKRIERQGK